MIILILGYNYFKKKDLIKVFFINGIFFWSSMYLSVIVVMVVIFNVYVVFLGGMVVVLVGLIVIIVGFFFVLVLLKIGWFNIEEVSE